MPTSASYIQEPSGNPSGLPERLLHRIWQAQLALPRRLHTQSGPTVEVLDPGQLNAEAGPDFSNAHLRIDGLDWHGDIELHLSSGLWRTHGHERDPAYDRVILHVVLHADIWTGRLQRPDGTPLPEVVLSDQIEGRFVHIIRNAARRRPLPHCRELLAVPALDLTAVAKWLDTLGRQRIDERAHYLQERARLSTTEDAIFERVLRALGYHPNADAMEHLARRLPVAQLRPLSQVEREALLLGAAGLLPSAADLIDADRGTADYCNQLREHFSRLRHRMRITPLRGTWWTRGGVRPANQPARRLVQAAALFEPGALFAHDADRHLRSALRHERPMEQLDSLLTASPPRYWRDHLTPAVPGTRLPLTLGPSRREAIIRNALIPAAVAFLPDAETDAALELLSSMARQEHAVTRRFESAGIPVAGARAGLGTNQLADRFCAELRCRSCLIGQQLLDLTEH